MARKPLPPRKLPPKREKSEELEVIEDEQDEDELIVLGEKKEENDEPAFADKIELDETFADGVVPVPVAKKPMARTFQPDVSQLNLEEGLKSAEEQAEESWSEPEEQESSGKLWLGITAIALVMIVGAAIFLTSRFQNKAPAAPEKSKIVVDETTRTLNPITDKDVIDGRTEYRRIENLLRKFYSVTTVDELLLLVRHRERLEPWIRDYYSEHELKFQNFQSITTFATTSVLDRPFWVLQAILDDGSTAPVLVGQNDTGDYLVDWESLVTHQQHDWAELQKTRPQGEFMVRCRLQKSDLNIYEYRDRMKWTSLTLFIPDTDIEFRAYVDASLPANVLLSQTFVDAWETHSSTKISAMVKVKFPQETRTKNSVEIVEFLSPSWTFANDPSASE